MTVETIAELNALVAHRASAENFAGASENYRDSSMSTGYRILISNAYDESTDRMFTVVTLYGKFDPSELGEALDKMLQNS